MFPCGILPTRRGYDDTGLVGAEKILKRRMTKVLLALCLALVVAESLDSVSNMMPALNDN